MFYGVNDMFKKKLRARVVYVDNDKTEGYAIEILVNNKWELHAYYPFLVAENDNVISDYLHYSIIRNLGELQLMGYKVDLAIKKFGMA